MARPGDIARAIELPGPWTHRHVAANGARFHVAECAPVGRSDAPLVLFLHGFPAFWWSWRRQLPAVAAVGFHAVAMDLRGYGGSDKTPDGYDPFTLGHDVAGVVKALGERQAVLVGHGWGGYVAWATAVLHPREVSALGVVAAPHPLVMLRALPRAARIDALRHVLAMQVPMRPERRLADPASGYLRDHLVRWSAPGSAFPEPEVVSTYQTAIGLWPASHCALEYHRWLMRSRLRGDGRAFSRRMTAPVGQPVLSVMGADDPALPPGAVEESRRHVVGPITEHVLPGVGHFAPEEDPAAFEAALLPWLTAL
ncbi:MAG: alpha/beta fold hydrolase [Nocardioides sp.]